MTESKGTDADRRRTIDFTTVVLSLRESTRVLLDELPAEEGRERSDGLVGVQLQIETLDVLLDRTAGNLTPDEDRLLRTVLYELRLAYVEASRSVRS
jgi:hypothetical protein